MERERVMLQEWKGEGAGKGNKEGTKENVMEWKRGIGGKRKEWVDESGWVMEFKEDKEVKWNKRKGKEESNVPKGKCDGNRKGKERTSIWKGKGQGDGEGNEMYNVIGKERKGDEKEIGVMKILWQKGFQCEDYMEIDLRERQNEKEKGKLQSDTKGKERTKGNIKKAVTHIPF